MRAGDDDPNIRVIVLTGVGRGFCSGANLGSRATPDITGENLPGNRGSHEGPDAARQHFFHGFTKLHRDISLIRKPTIAMINGPAVGSGMDMALHCDIRSAARRPASSATTMPDRSSRTAVHTIFPRWSASAVPWSSSIPAN